MFFIRREHIPLFFFGFFGGMVVAKAGEVWNVKALLIIGGLSMICTICICLFRSAGGLKGCAQVVAVTILVLAIILVAYWLWPWGQGNQPVGSEQAPPGRRIAEGTPPPKGEGSGHLGASLEGGRKTGLPQSRFA